VPKAQEGGELRGLPYRMCFGDDGNGNGRGERGKREKEDISI